MDNTTTKKSLRERAKQFSVQLPFMDGREKGKTEELLGTVTTIREFGFLKSEDGNDYAVFIVDERQKYFYFGGKVITDQLQQLEAEGYHEEINEEGLPMLMTEKKSKNKRSYTSVEFYPEDVTLDF